MIIGGNIANQLCNKLSMGYMKPCFPITRKKEIG